MIIYIIIPTFASCLCGYMLTPQTKVVTYNQFIHLSIDAEYIIINFSKHKTVRDSIHLPTEYIWENQKFCQHVIKNLKPLTKYNQVDITVNNSKHLDRFVASLENQSYPNWRLTIVGFTHFNYGDKVQYQEKGSAKYSSSYIFSKDELLKKYLNN